MGYILTIISHCSTACILDIVYRDAKGGKPAWHSRTRMCISIANNPLLCAVNMKIDEISVYH